MTVTDIPAPWLLRKFASLREIAHSSGIMSQSRIAILAALNIADELHQERDEREKAKGALADQAAKEGIPDLRRSALKKVRDGLISLEEANRVTKD